MHAICINIRADSVYIDVWLAYITQGSSYTNIKINTTHPHIIKLEFV